MYINISFNAFSCYLQSLYSYLSLSTLSTTYIQSAIILFLSTNIRNNYVTIQSFIFQYCDSNIGLFSIPPCKVITLNPLCIFLVSVLCFFFIGFLSKFIALPTSCRSFSLLKAIAIRLPLLFANAFKSVKERQLLLS